MLIFNHNYIYLGDRSKARTNVITIAYEIEKAEFNDTNLNVEVIKFGIAFSNSKDLYDKTLGKKLASYRCNGMPYRFFKTKFGITHTIFTGMLKQDLPSWAHDMSVEYLFIHKMVDK